MFTCIIRRLILSS